MPKNDASLISRHDLSIALALLTRLPVKVAHGNFDRTANAAWAYPLAGAVLGAFAGLAGMAALWIGLPPIIAALLALAVLIITSGAMHEDGLADTADGFWGGWAPEKRLEIMKDSQIGTYGVLALLLSLGLRTAALSEIFAGGAVLLPVIAVAALSRGFLPAVMAALPHARTHGLAHSVGRPSRQTAVLAAGVGLAIAALSIGALALLALIVVGLVAFFVGTAAHRKIGGQTGDILGATQQLGEIAVLLLLIP
ncbi:MAG: adenosylcobinamide-GDP ribazoletransferase [Rhodobacterales bacterium]|nr:adenosylcobinamide-GDP ribazoletransferase [Rhodobacterales bacterium]